MSNKNNIIAEISDKIFEKRTSLGLTQTDVALEAGVDQGTVCQIEKVDCNPKLATLVEVLYVLGLKLSIEELKNEKQKNL